MIRSLPRKFASYRPGQYSRMMDMGGAPQAKSSVKLDFGQKNKVQAIALDFNLITRAVEEASSKGTTVGSSSVLGSTTKTNIDSGGRNSSPKASSSIFERGSAVMPNVGLIQDIANLLNVNMGGEEETNNKKNTSDPDEATLATLFSKTSNDGDESTSTAVTSKTSSSTTTTPNKPTMSNIPNQQHPFLSDIRSKYASKLEKKIDGGVSSLDRHQEDKLSSRGDAAFHLAARAIATNKNNPGSTTSTTGPARWLAASGTSKLLSFLSSRSMKIALLPIPRSEHAGPNVSALSTLVQDSSSSSSSRAMEDLTQQLPQVQFHLLIKTNDGIDSANVIVRQVQDTMSKDHGILPMSTLLVSDRDDYLREGRDMGFYTCRIRPKNVRRGNVTTNFTTETIAEVEDVINELNGLSMNSVLTSGT